MPLPSFDWQSINAPGGIMQGLGALGTALTNASVRRRELEAQAAAQKREQAYRDQQLAMQQQAQDLRGEQFAETKRANAAGEDIRRQELGLRGLQSFGGGLKSLVGGLSGMFDPYKQAQIENLQLRNEQLRNPKPRAMTVDQRIGVDKLYKGDVDALNRERMMNPEAFSGKPASGGWWTGGETPAVPPARDYNAELEALRSQYEARYPGWNPETPPQGGLTSMANPPAGSYMNLPLKASSPIRQQITQLYGGQLPPEVEQSLREAEAGDQESMQQLQEMLAPPAR